MRLRLARARVEELHRTDLAGSEPAGLIVIVERLVHTVEDLLALADEGCQGGDCHRQNP
jgi:hypothetical protein